MVLADRGIVCIDEFDKMDEADRVAIHEVMEQQTVTIAKAGIHTSLNSRCSVIAAANPIYGEYQKDLPPTRNIGLPDSLLSRFDLLFVVLDEKNPENDRLVAERVTRNHRYIAANWEDQMTSYDNDGNYTIEPEDVESKKSSEVFEKFNSIIHNKSQHKDLLTQNFLKKYIFYAKKTVQPVLQDEAIDYITNVWTKLRQRDIESLNSGGARNLPITIRTLETIIRISTAHAKLRLKKQVEEFDCRVAVELLNYALFNEKIDMDKYDDEGDDGDDDDHLEHQGGHKRSIRRKINDGDFKYYSAKKGGEDEKRVTRSSRKGDGTMEEEEQEVMIVDKQPERRAGPTPSQAKSSQKSAANSGKGRSLRSGDSDKFPTKKFDKNLRIEDEEEVMEVIERNIRATLEINLENKKFLYKVLIQHIGDNRNKGTIAVDSLWDIIKDSKEKGALETKDHMIKCLTELDNEDKIMYSSPREKYIYMI